MSPCFLRSVCDVVDVASSGFELAEVAGVGGVGDDVEVGAGGERELFGVALGESVDEVVFGVVEVLGGEWDAGGVGSFADAGGVSCGGVEVCGVACSGEGDVPGFAVETGGSDDVDVFAGEALCFVDGGGVAVVDVAAVDVFAVQPDTSAVAEFDVDTRFVVVDVGDGADHPVVDAASSTGVEVDLSGHVAKQDDAIADLKLSCTDRECEAGELPGRRCSLAGEGVEELGFGARAGNQVCVAPGGVGVPPVVDGTGADFVCGVGEDDSVVFGVRVPEGCEVAIAEVVEGGVFPLVALASVDREFAASVAESAKGCFESATRSDLGKLMVVADEDNLCPSQAGTGDDLVQVDGAAHRGFIDDDDRVRIDECMVREAWDGERFDASAIGEFACRPGRWADTDKTFARSLVDLANGAHRVGLARPGAPHDNLDGEPLYADTLDGVGLIGTERPAETAQDCRDERRIERAARVRCWLEVLGEFGLQSEESPGRPFLFPASLDVRGGRHGDEFVVCEDGVGESFEHRRVCVFAELFGDSVLDFVASDAGVALR